jgi:hypothetical protein
MTAKRSGLTLNAASWSINMSNNTGSFWL